jgi:cytochrome oxidase assembly protein ShyY1
VLRTALKPRWIAALVLALAVSWVFVLLSQWQFSRSTQTSEAPAAATETVKPLTDVLQPGTPITQSAEDQLVTATGSYDRTRQVLVQGRLQDGRNGFWVVDAFVVDGAPTLNGAAGNGPTIIPVARGWMEHPDQVPAPPTGAITLSGRLIPSEAPNPKPNNLPAGQVASLSTAQLVNIWDVSSYPAFVVANSEVAAGIDVSAHAVAGPLQGITVRAQPESANFNWLNIFYAVEWVVFAGFAVFLWWRLVADDYRRSQEPDDDYDDDDDDDGDGDGDGDDDAPDPVPPLSREVTS